MVAGFPATVPFMFLGDAMNSERVQLWGMVLGGATWYYLVSRFIRFVWRQLARFLKERPSDTD